MFNVGGGELLVILLLGLLILGPERLPKAMGEIGRYVAQLRKLSSGFQDEIRRAMDPEDVPFRPGDERLRPHDLDEEVRVVGADPPADDDGIIDTSAIAHDPSHAPVDEDPPADVEPDAHGETGPTDAAGAEAQGGDVTAGEAGRGNVTPLHGRDDGGTRAAG